MNLFVWQEDARAGEQLGRVGIVGHHADVVGSELEIYGVLHVNETDAFFLYKKTTS